MQKNSLVGAQTYRGNPDANPEGSHTTRGNPDHNLECSQTARGHLDNNRALNDASNRTITPRKELGVRLTSRQTSDIVSPKPMLSSRIAYNPPVK
jgi:hypothetical protein